MQGKLQPAIYGKPIDKTALSYKAFIAKKFFTPREFACLLAEIDPTSFDGTTESEQVFLSKVQSYVNAIEENIEPATRLVPSNIPFGDDFVETEYRQLMGFDETAKDFPVKAEKKDMKRFDFACKFLKVEDGTEIIKCRDLPELLSWPSDGETLEQWARYAVEDCIAFRIRDGEIIPEATEPEAGEFVVRLSSSEEAKILLHNEMVRAKVSRADLARRAKMRLPDVTRLLNIRQPTKIDTVATALNSLGMDFQLSVVPR